MQTFKNLHLLFYVEDDVQIRHEISEFLRRYFGLLYEVSSAEEALEYYTRFRETLVKAMLDTKVLTSEEAF